MWISKNTIQTVGLLTLYLSNQESNNKARSGASGLHFFAGHGMDSMTLVITSSIPVPFLADIWQ